MAGDPIVAGLSNSVKRLVMSQTEGSQLLTREPPWYESEESVVLIGYGLGSLWVKPDHEAQAPSNDQSRQGQIDQPIGLWKLIILSPPKIIKARITKGGNCNKDGVKDPMAPAKARNKASHEEQGPQSLNGKVWYIKDGADKRVKLWLLLKN